MIPIPDLVNVVDDNCWNSSIMTAGNNRCLMLKLDQNFEAEVWLVGFGRILKIEFVIVYKKLFW